VPLPRFPILRPPCHPLAFPPTQQPSTVPGGTALSDALTVRPVAPADFAQWLPLWVGYHRFYGRAIADDVTRVT